MSDPSIFYVPTEDHNAKVELSLLPGVYATLVQNRKELRVQELVYERELDRLRDIHYFKERVSQSQKDAEKSSKLTQEYGEVYRRYINIYARREEVEGYLKAIEMKAKALDVIIRSEIGDKYIQR